MGRCAARAVSGKPGDAPIGINYFAGIISLLAVKFLQHSDPVRTGSGVSITDCRGKLGRRPAIAYLTPFDNQIIIAKAVKFTKFDYVHFASEIAIIVSCPSLNLSVKSTSSPTLTSWRDTFSPR